MRPTPEVHLRNAQANLLAGLPLNRDQRRAIKKANDERLGVSACAGNGGKRRHHCPPALTAETLPIVAEMRRQGASLRAIAAVVNVDAETVRHAVNHTGAYQGSGI